MFTRAIHETNIEERKKLADAIPRGICGNTVEGGDHFQVFETGERLEHRTGVRDKTDTFFHLDAITKQVVAADGGGAGAGREHTGEHLQCGGFSCAVRSEQPDNLAGGNFQRQAIYGGLLAEFFRERVE